MDRVSVIIVNFNGGSLLADCVRSVLDSTVPVEVFVSDNGSTDGSVEFLQDQISDERLHVILNNENLGFAKASNIPLARASGELLLFLNPDCRIFPDTLEQMKQAIADHPLVGMAGCLILNQNGTEQAGCRRRVPTPARAMIRILHLDKLFPFLREKGMLLHQQPLPDAPKKMEAISGAFMLVRRQALEDVGPLDEGYFLHCEDLDWCMRFRNKKWQILFVPHVTIEHVKGGCSSTRPIRVEWYKHKGMVRFYRKFFRHQYPAILMWGVISVVWLRFAAKLVMLNIRRLFS